MGKLAAAEAAIAARGRVVVRRMSVRAGQAMRPWFSEEVAEVLLPRVAGTISRLFDESSRSQRDDVLPAR